MYPNNNNNNIFKKEDKIKTSKVKNDGRGSVRIRERERERFFFSLLVSLSDLRKSDRRFLSEQKEKLDYAMRATCRYQYLCISSNHKR